MPAQMMEHARDTVRGGGVIPSAIPSLLTSLKYSVVAIKTTLAMHVVNHQPPATTAPPIKMPIPVPKITLFCIWFLCGPFSIMLASPTSFGTMPDPSISLTWNDSSRSEASYTKLWHELRASKRWVHSMLMFYIIWTNPFYFASILKNKYLI